MYKYQVGIDVNAQEIHIVTSKTPLTDDEAVQIAIENDDPVDIKYFDDTTTIVEEIK